VDCYTAALTLLARRELSARQLRDRLARRKYAAEEIDPVITRLTQDGTLDDRRVALASARQAAIVKRRGRRRILQEIQRLGIGSATAKQAVEEVFAEVDENVLLDVAIQQRLKNVDPKSLDRRARARLARSLIAQGHDADRVYARLRTRAVESDE
jgi:regulatory protein